MWRFLFVFALLTMSPGLASAEAFDHASAVKEGNASYNAGDYAAAQRWYVQAIQADPNQPAPYRNLARAYFWQDQYAAASTYYDHYLRLAPLDAADVEQIKAERKLASDRASGDTWMIPDNQRLARQALDTELQSGKAYTDGGGGAWGLYETLLRTGYAQPDLAQLRATLAQRLVAEFETLLQPQGTDLVPQLSFEAWQVQSQRLAVSQRITNDSAAADALMRRSTVVEAALALLGGRTNNAVDLARLARTQNPDLKWVGWYEVVALTQAGKHQESIEALESFARTLRQVNPAQLPYATAMKAMLLQRLERWDDAAQTFQLVLQ